MNRKWTYAIAATLTLIALVVVLRQVANAPKDKKMPSRDDLPTTSPSAASTPSPVSATSQKIDEKHKEDVRTGMKALIEGLKQKGVLREVSPISQQLQTAIDSKDAAEMHRAFQDAIYSPSSSMNEAIPALRAYLKSPDPYVRYLAAETLLRAGDKSGVPMLIDTINSKSPVLNGTTDLRFSAVRTLGLFQIESGAESIRNLYSATKEGELLRSLANLGVQAKEASGWKFVPSSLAIENYAKEGSTQFTSQIATTFNQTSDATTKNAAAWALAEMTGEARYVDYLIEAARPAIAASKDQTSFNASTEALRYLGSVQSPAAVTVLEEALESRNHTAVQYATVNLLFNQPGRSEKAKQLVINQFEGKHSRLNWELAMQIASKLDDSRVKAAAQAFDLRTSGDRWRYWGVERSNWPIQNWVYDYAVTLNP